MAFAETARALRGFQTNVFDQVSLDKVALNKRRVERPTSVDINFDKSTEIDIET